MTPSVAATVTPSVTTTATPSVTTTATHSDSLSDATVTACVTEFTTWAALHPGPSLLASLDENSR